MRETPIHQPKEITIRFVKLSKWLWKTSAFFWSILLVAIFSLLSGIIGNLFTSSWSSSLRETPLGWLLQYPIFILLIVGSLLLLNAVIYFGSHLDIDLSDKELKRIYLKRIIRETETLALIGIPAGLVATSAPLDEVFIPLQFRRNRPLIDYPLTEEEIQQYLNLIENASDTGEIQNILLEAEKSWEHMPKGTARISITDLWQQLTRECPVAVIQGYPGMGKTILLSRLTLYMARRGLGQLDPLMPDTLDSPLIPILLKLREYASECIEHSVANFSISDYLKRRVMRPDVPGVDSFLAKSLDTGRCLVMLDGLDEVSEPNLKKDVEEAIKAFVRKYWPLSSNGTKNNAKELEQRVRIDQMCVMLLEPHREEDVAVSGWPMQFRLGQLAGCFQWKRFYASLTSFALSSDSSGSCSVSSSSRNGWKAP